MSASDNPFPIVAIGASAGGVEALEAFFRPFEAECGMAFVVITHLSRAHKSMLPDIIGRFTPLTVHVAEDGMVVAVNQIYVMAEDTILGIKNGVLSVRHLGEQRERKPIDLFFIELAMDQGDYACGVVLSGGDGDGSLGVRAIKERGGTTLAQSGDIAPPRHPSMPSNAIATGLVDFAIPAAEMAAALLYYVGSFESLEQRRLGDAGTRALHEAAQREIYALLRNQIGHDFSGYKVKTFNRRVHRRMQVLQVQTLEAYVERIKQEPAELTLLFRDLLINVTSFFRDPDAFDALAAQVIPRLFDGKGAEDTVRVWVPGCASGEEVFSIAMLMREHMDTLRGVPRVQIFATDIDEQSLVTARAARFPAGLLQGMPAKRRARFFVMDGGTFVLTKEIRDLCIFSPHSVIRDPPFSRMDLVSCRNLLIYFGAEIQAQVIPTFHYALRPDGYLMLGTSENISQFADIFTPIDKKNRLFRAREDGRALHALPFLFKNMHTHVRSGTVSGGKPSNGNALRGNVEMLVMERFAPPHVVVNEEGEIVYFSSRTGKYLEAAPGVPSRQLLPSARKGLRVDLRTALREAVDTRRLVTRSNIHIEADDERVQMVTITIEALPDRAADNRLFIIVFADNGPSMSREDAVARSHGTQDEALSQMERELRDARERLQSMLEEYETALEELKASNEELVSVNEELQSTNEELETSKEELQSLNEELHTVNAELTIKVDALDRSNSDLNNLFESTQIATVFLDQGLAIRSFTPPMARLFNILPTDCGRPLSDFASRLDYPMLHDDIAKTLASGEASERRVDFVDGREHFMARLRAYRELDGAIRGVICTFFDVTTLVQAQTGHRALTEELADRDARTDR